MSVLVAKTGIRYFMFSNISFCEKLQQLMQWQREGLLSALEFQKAKEKVLGEEPNLSRMACLAAPPKPGIRYTRARNDPGEGCRKC